jgi:hypothetical protein
MRAERDLACATENAFDPSDQEKQNLCPPLLLHINREERFLDLKRENFSNCRITFLIHVMQFTIAAVKLYESQ